MNNIYQKLSDARRLLTPEDTDYEIKAHTHSLKPLSLSEGQKPRFLRLYTDGSTLVSQNNKKESTFSGWGMYIMSFQNGERRKIGNVHGCILNGNPLLAELSAIKRGLEFVDRPSCVSLVCDSTDAIKELLNLDNLDSELQKFMDMTPKDRYENTRYRTVKLLSDIQQLMSSKNILACEVKWQPSHTMDKADVTMDELHEAMNQEKDPDKKLFMLDVHGNEKADKEAGLGSKKAVRVSLLDLKNREENMKAKGMFHLVNDYLDKSVYVNFSKVTAQYGKDALADLRQYCKGLNQVAKHLHGNRTAKEIGIEFFAANTKGYISKLLIDKLFTEKDQQKINAQREFMLKNGVPARNKNGNLSSVAQKMTNGGYSEDRCLKKRRSPKDWARQKVKGKRNNERVDVPVH